MRYRKLSPTGDMVFGHGQADYYINNSQAVAQAIQTALKLVQGEWFLDTTAGVPYFTQIVGYNTQSLYDAILRAAILAVEGVTDLVSYTSNLNPVTRLLTVSAVVNNQFGTTTIVNNVPIPPLAGYGIAPYGVGGYGL